MSKTNTAQTNSSDAISKEAVSDFEYSTAATTDATMTISTQENKPELSKRQQFFKFVKKHKILLSILSFVSLILIVLIALGVYTFSVAQELKAQAGPLQMKSQEVYALFKAQNLPAAEEKLLEIDQDFQNVKSTYAKLSFYNNIPFVNAYYQDGERGLRAGQAGLDAAKKSIEAITPYADVLGFSGAEFTGGTTEDRLKVILETLEKITPILDEIATDLETVESELTAIDPNRYPEEVQGTEIRSNIVLVQELSSGAANALTEYRPVIEEIPKVAGAGGEKRKYLILFQNDNELRPTGGFLTAYAIINITDGKVEARQSDDIYELDQRFTQRIPIPEELGRYLTTERYWNLRDMNTSPDFKVSMDQFYEHYQTVPGEPEDIDGIIALDTHFLTNLMKVLGPVEVPGYGTFSAETDPRCDCPQIIYVLSEIITKPTPYIREDRKGILGPLMRALLTKAYAAPKQEWPNLFQTGFESILNRHAQFYFFNEETQQAAEAAKVAGRMVPPKNGEDFLAIINSNLGGAKSNLFITYDVTQTVPSAPENGKLTKTVDVTYKNTHAADNCNLEAGELCLNSTLRDWTRLYVPAGAELIDAQGFLEEARTYEENGFTVIDGFFTLEPLGSAKLSVTYSIPYEDTQDYKLLMWKQGGIESFEALLDITGGQEIVTVEKDTLYETFF